MAQHLYPCQCCGVYGVAHYVLRRDPESRLVLICTGCHRAGCVPKGSAPLVGCHKRPKEVAA